MESHGLQGLLVQQTISMELHTKNKLHKNIDILLKNGRQINKITIQTEGTIHLKRIIINRWF